MAKRIVVDVSRLFLLWNDAALTRAEVARRLRLTHGQLTSLAQRYKLAKRPHYKPRGTTVPDPTPEEIEQRARECRELHYKARRDEDEATTVAKVLQVGRRSSGAA